jgi:Ca2+:H+ antiporter
MTASLVTNSGRSAWFVGVLVLLVYMIFAMTLYLLPPRLRDERTMSRSTTENSAHRGYDVSLFVEQGELNRGPRGNLNPFLLSRHA